MTQNDVGTCQQIDTPLTRRNLGLFARDLHRKLRTMPKEARQFAFNLIELIETGTAFRPRVSDHKLQDPRRLLEWQMAQLELAMKAA